MTQTIPIPGPPSRRHLAVLAVLLRRWLRNARTRRALAALADDRLADIGIGRRARSIEAAKPFWRR